ncbi:DUF1488 domain-containing protein [Photorhabdus noenieputensis]|uniref:DUF1488 domain-containing protein n=1 Tax=Photorhabdus noenieputensis TaxID=1208607 RepID=UPI001BD30AED|nr:DUF1488 domain-containing protein [Photorhabdus noenieputensis]MBS9439807.1 DUF1488 domain-containing protein [Photorhabdus noenieputensis]MCK3669310.1 DUF1488 domain-containing protein [Photorhabdus noenieputensis]
MNQSIQFPDREEWNEQEQIIIFPALVNGWLVQCVISAEDLLYRYGTKDHHPLSLFRQNRWDIEEEFELVINNEDDDRLGRYILPSCK